MRLKIKKISSSAKTPTYARKGDAGMDLTATTVEFSKTMNVVTYGTGLQLEIDPGYVGLIFPRSSIKKTGMGMSNAVGVIDSGYRGEVMVTFYHGDTSLCYRVGERIAQLVIVKLPYVNIEEVKELSESERGNGGFGSTGL